MIKRLCFVIYFLIPLWAESQVKKTRYISRTTAETGLSISGNSAMTALSLHAEQFWGLGHNHRHVHVGLGARLTSSFGSGSLTYITAPAQLTSGKTGPGVFFTSNISNNIDTVTLNNTQVNALNVFILLNYTFSQRWSAEFNIDLVGFSFGGDKNATLFYGDGNTFYSKYSEAKPTSTNVLLISDNDIGSLNSELNVFYRFTNKVKLKAGFGFLFNEYTLTSPINYINTLGTNINTARYRTKALMLGIGFNYTLK